MTQENTTHMFAYFQDRDIVARITPDIGATFPRGLYPSRVAQMSDLFQWATLHGARFYEIRDDGNPSNTAVLGRRKNKRGRIGPHATLYKAQGGELTLSLWHKTSEPMTYRSRLNPHNEVLALQAAINDAALAGCVSVDIYIENYPYESWGDTIEFANTLGFDEEAEEADMIEAYGGEGDISDQRRCDIADALEEAALECIRKAGFTIRYDGD